MLRNRFTLIGMLTHPCIVTITHDMGKRLVKNTISKSFYYELEISDAFFHTNGALSGCSICSSRTQPESSLMRSRTR